MKVFVTGAAGFLGSHVCERFRDLGHEVVGIDNLMGGDLDNVPDGIRFEELDCLDREACTLLMRNSDIVYHCAAAAYDGLSLFSPSFVFRHTVQATVEVATAAVVCGVDRFVHCSSMARYGALPAPFTEDLTPAPVTPYGIAKRTSEDIVVNLFQAHGGEYVIAVPHNIIGPRQRFNDPYRNVAAIMINRMLKGLQPIIYGDGTHTRCFSFITDVIFCLEQMGVSLAAAGETFNIGPDEGAVSILTLAAEIADLLDFRLDPIFVPDRPTEVAVATCSANKARNLLGYRTSTTLRDGLGSMVEWIAARGPKDFCYDIPVEITGPRTPSTWTDKLI